MRLLVAAAALAAGGCRSYVDSTPRRVLDSDPRASYERIFGQGVPRDVDIVHAVVVDYSWRPGVVTTDDWAIELIAPRSWIDEQLRELRLSSADPDWGFEDLEQGGESGLPDWYAPPPLDGYERYALSLTSIPYVHMLVAKAPEPDSRHRVFAWKR